MTVNNKSFSNLLKKLKIKYKELIDSVQCSIFLIEYGGFLF